MLQKQEGKEVRTEIATKNVEIDSLNKQIDELQSTAKKLYHERYHQQDGSHNSSLSYIEEKLKTTDSVLQSTEDTLEEVRKKYEDKIKSHEDNITQENSSSDAVYVNALQQTIKRLTTENAELNAQVESLNRRNAMLRGSTNSLRIMLQRQKGKEWLTELARKIVVIDSLNKQIMALHKQVESTTTKESDQYHQQDGNQNSSLSYIEEKLKTTDSVLQSTKDTLEVMRKKYEDKIKSHEDNIKQLERRISSQCTSQSEMLQEQPLFATLPEKMTIMLKEKDETIFNLQKQIKQLQLNSSHFSGDVAVCNSKLRMELEAAKKATEVVMDHMNRLTQCAEEEQKATEITLANHYQVVEELQDDLKAQAAQTEVAAHEKKAIIEQFEIEAKEKNEIIKQLEDNIREYSAQLEAVHRETENSTQSLEMEHHQAIEKLNAKYQRMVKQLEDDLKKEKEDIIKSLNRKHQAALASSAAKTKEKDELIIQLEDNNNVLTAQLEASQQTFEREHQRLTKQLNDLKVQLAKALDPLENIEELKEVVDLNEEIGRGAYGVVKKVSLHGTICAAKDIHAVIINYAQPRELDFVKKNYLEECIKCSKLFHPNIVQFLGIHYPSEDAKLPWLVMEKMDCSLTSFLTNHTPANVSVNAKISIIHDISLGLQYLHARDIIHRDLSSNNILLTKHLTAKIADLGVAKLIDPDGTRSHTLAPGTQFFLPPEAMIARPHYGKPVDVFSLGCVMIHLMTHEWPEPAPETHYSAKLKKKVALSEIERRQRYIDRISRPTKIKELIFVCLHDSENERPMIAQVCAEVEKVKEN